MSRERAQALLCSNFGPFYDLRFPYRRMGAVDTLDLFGPNELMIFALYHHNRARWRKALDVGANQGLHAILMAKLGWTVRAFEPDPEIFADLADNLRINELENVDARCAAISATGEPAKFVRVHGNRTGSHLAGMKESYGERETLTVDTYACAPQFAWADFAKIDAEGAEAEILGNTTRDTWARLCAVVEVGNVQNAVRIYLHFAAMGVPLWAQKVDWRRVERPQDVPTHHSEGSLFIGHGEPWK